MVANIVPILFLLNFTYNKQVGTLRNFNINKRDSSPFLYNSYIYIIPTIRLCNTIIKDIYIHSHPYSSIYSHSCSFIYFDDCSSALLSNLSLVDFKLVLSVTSSADLELRLGFFLRFFLMRLSCIEVLLGFPSIQSCCVRSFSCLTSISLIQLSCIKTFSILKNSLLEIKRLKAQNLYSGWGRKQKSQYML